MKSQAIYILLKTGSRKKKLKPYFKSIGKVIIII